MEKFINFYSTPLQKKLQEFKECIEYIGVEVSEEKSKLVKENGKFVQERTKFLGMEYHTETNQIWSKTRSGTMKKVRDLTDEGLKAFLKENPDVPYITRKELDRIGNTFAVEIGAELGFLGCLMAEAWSPRNLEPFEQKEEIERGKFNSWMKIRNSYSEYKGEGGFIWKFQDLHPVIATLTNVSSIATHVFLESKTIRDRGMRQYSKEGRRIRSKRRVSRTSIGMELKSQ